MSFIFLLLLTGKIITDFYVNVFSATCKLLGLCIAEINIQTCALVLTVTKIFYVTQIVMSSVSQIVKYTLEKANNVSRKECFHILYNN